MTGGTGLVGSHLSAFLAEKGHQVTVLTRSSKAGQSVTFLEGDPSRKGVWQEQVAKHDLIINLAGASIFRRWTEEAKALIRESRLRTTENLVEALSGNPEGATLISTSAVGYYGAQGEERLDETSPAGGGFLASLSAEWEAEAQKAETKGVRVVICRFGIVLAPDGGALSTMIPLFKKGLGSPLGRGKQWMSWIHIHDLLNVYDFLIQHGDMAGAFNCTSPQPVRNREFTRALADSLGRPALLPGVPGFVLKTVMGEFGSMLLEGQRVEPKRLMDAGFTFRFADVREALRDLLQDQK